MLTYEVHVHLASSRKLIFGIFPVRLFRLSFDFLFIDVLVEVVELVGQFFLGSYGEVSNPNN